jgi:ABC-type glutathione transport system ATPase component
MSQIDHLRKLITIKNRRLQKLKETQALYGPTVDPKTLIEIEDLEEEIESLQEELQNVEQDTSQTPSILASLPISPAFAHAQMSEIYWANRKNELKALAEIWESKQVKVVGLIGWGGVGKSTLARRWYERLPIEFVKHKSSEMNHTVFCR